MSLRPTTTACWPAMGMSAALEDFDDARGGAGGQSRTAGLEAARVYGVKAVDILGGVDGVEQDFGVDLARQGELDEDAVDVVAAIEGGNEVEHGFGGDVLGWRDEVAEDAEFGAGLDFVADVDLGGGDVADEDCGEAGTNALGGKDADIFGDFLLNGGGDGGAVEDSWHSCAPWLHRIAFRRKAVAGGGEFLGGAGRLGAGFG